MLKTYFESARRRAHYYRGAAGPYLDDFCQWLAEHGYQARTGRRHVGGAHQRAEWGRRKNSQWRS